MGRVSVRSRTELLVLNGTLTGQRYINEVQQPVVLPFVQQHHVVLQDDNATVEHDRYGGGSLMVPRSPAG